MGKIVRWLWVPSYLLFMLLGAGAYIVWDDPLVLEARNVARYPQFRSDPRITFALYVALALMAAMPVWRLAIWWRGDRPHKYTGFCRECGYDLRATPDRCPECGTRAQGA